MKKLVLILLSIFGLMMLSACSQESYTSDVVEFDLGQIFHHLESYERDELKVVVMKLIEEHTIFYSNKERNPLEVTVCNTEKAEMLSYIRGINEVIFDDVEKKELAYYLPTGEIVELNYYGGSCFFKLGGNLNTVNENGLHLVLEPLILDESSAFYKHENLPKTREDILDFYDKYAIDGISEVELQLSEELGENINYIGYKFTYLGRGFAIYFTEQNENETSIEYKIIRYEQTIESDQT